MRRNIVVGLTGLGAAVGLFLGIGACAAPAAAATQTAPLPATAPPHTSYVTQDTPLWIGGVVGYTLLGGTTVQVNCWEVNASGTLLYNVTVIAPGWNANGASGDIGASVTGNTWSSAPHCGANGA